MTIEMARIRIQESVDKIGIFDPAEARELAIAIHVLIGAALARGKHMSEEWPSIAAPDRRAEDKPK